MELSKEVAIEIIEIVEDLLEEKGIIIPSEDRKLAIQDGENPEDMAPIYGIEYFDLEDDIANCIRKYYGGD